MACLLTQFSGWHRQQESEWSPDGSYIGGYILHRILIRESQFLTIVATFAVSKKIDQIQWAPDSDTFLCHETESDVVWIFKVSDPECRLLIEHKDVGIARSYWTYQSHYICTISNFRMCFSIWKFNEIEKQSEIVTSIRRPKFSNRGFAFNQKKPFLAVCLRENEMEQLCIVNTNNWKVIKTFEICTHDAQEVQWLDGTNQIFVWESLISARFAVYDTDGIVQLFYDNTKDFIGIHCISLNQTYHVLAIGYGDGSIMTFNTQNWKLLNHWSLMDENEESCEWTIYKEKPQETLDSSKSENIVPQFLSMQLDESNSMKNNSQFELLQLSRNIFFDVNNIRLSTSFNKLHNSLDNDAEYHDKHLINMSDSILPFIRFSWSPCGQFIAINEDKQFPTVLWIREMPSLRVRCILSFVSNILDFVWDPNSSPSRLAIISENYYRVYCWSSECFSPVIIEQAKVKPFKAVQIVWKPTAPSQLLLKSKENSMCTLYLKNLISK